MTDKNKWVNVNWKHNQYAYTTPTEISACCQIDALKLCNMQKPSVETDGWRQMKHRARVEQVTTKAKLAPLNNIGRQRKPTFFPEHFRFSDIKLPEVSGAKSCVS